MLKINSKISDFIIATVVNFEENTRTPHANTDTHIYRRVANFLSNGYIQEQRSAVRAQCDRICSYLLKD